MTPKPVRKLISLKTHAQGLAAHFQWEKETLCDYLAKRIGYIEGIINDYAEEHGLVDASSYHELAAIAGALRRHHAAGLTAKVDLGNAFGDLRDFVEWDKEELCDYLVYGLVECDITSLFASDRANAPIGHEIVEIACAVLEHTDPEKLSQAFRSMERLQGLKRSIGKPSVAPVAPNPTPEFAPATPAAASEAASPVQNPRPERKRQGRSAA